MKKKKSDLPLSNGGFFGTDFPITDPRLNLAIRKGIHGDNVPKIHRNALLDGQQEDAPYRSMATGPADAHIGLTASHVQASTHSRHFPNDRFDLKRVFPSTSPRDYPALKNNQRD